MTEAALLEELMALHAQFVEAHRRMLQALQTHDLLGLVTASRQQGTLCSAQGALLAGYVASAVAAMPDVEPGYRAQVETLARRLRDEHGSARSQQAG